MMNLLSSVMKIIKIRCRVISISLLLAFVSVCPVVADEGVGAGLSDGVELFLRDRAVQFLQQVNAARRDPLAAAARLGVDEQIVSDVFVSAGLSSVQGLPPLAWNDLLTAATVSHGRDMFDRLYYDYVSPEGVTVEGRIAATGYQAFFVGEAMGALVFDGYVAPDVAIQALVDSLVRDELSGRAGREAGIFSPEVTEVGISFFAEAVDFLDGRPYVYLLLADFASPVQERHSLIVECNPQNRFIVRPCAEDRWLFPRFLRPGLAQMPLPEEDVDILVFRSDGVSSGLVGVHELRGQVVEGNVGLDLRVIQP